MKKTVANFVKMLFIVALCGRPMLAQDFLQQYQSNTQDETEKGQEHSSLRDIVRGGQAREEYSAQSVKVYDNASLKKLKPQPHALNLDPSCFKNYNLLNSGTEYYTLGSYGTAAGMLLYEGREKDPLKPSVFKAYHFDRKNTRYYRVYSPYSVLSGLFTGTEQLFEMLYTKNVKANWNVGGELKMGVGKGYYGASSISKLNSNSNARLWSWYQSSDLSYSIRGALILNNDNVRETGGLVTPDIFSTGASRNDAPFEPVKLDSAKTDSRNLVFFLEQYYALRHASEEGKGTEATIHNSLRYSSNHIVYTDDQLASEQENNFYAHFYLNPAFTNDFLKTTELSDTVEFALSTLHRNIDGLRLGVSYTGLSYVQHSIDVQKDTIPLKDVGLNDLSLSLKAAGGAEDALHLDLALSVSALGYKAWTHSFKASMSSPKLSKKLFLDYRHSYDAPAYFYTNYASNHHTWHKKLKNIISKYFALRYTPGPSLGLRVGGWELKNFVWLAQNNNEIEPRQEQERKFLFFLKVDTTFPLVKNFKLKTVICAQKVPQEIILTPQIFTQSTLFFEKQLFPNLFLQAGLDLTYFLMDKIYSYSPELNAFYIAEDARNESRKLRLDAFIAGNLGNATLFAKYAFLNGLLHAPTGFYTVQSYPMTYPALVLGVYWRFYD